MSDHLRLPPGPPTLPLVGALPWLARDPLRFYQQFALDYGPIAHAKIGPLRFYMVGDPMLVEELLTEKHKACVKDATTGILRPLVGQGLLTSEGELWKRQRKLCAQPFAPKRLLAYEHTMVACAERMFDRYRDGERRDFHHDSMQLTLEIVGRTLLGIEDPRALDRVGHIIDDVLAYLAGKVHSLGGLLPHDLPTPAYRRFQRAKRELDAIVSGVIDRVSREHRDADHLLARLVRARGDDGQGMSAQQLLDEAVTMLLAGHETTALTLMYAVYLLSEHPAQAAQLRDEVDRVLAGRAVRAVDLEQLPFLDAVIREALRLYPPAYAFGRQAIESFELGGFTIPVGAQVIASPYAMHRNPRLWSEPESFLPQRWLSGETRQQPRYAYMPFGGGPRVCIGSHFAMLEAALLLATLVQRASLQVHPGFHPQLQPVVTLRSKHGLPVTVQRRAAIAPVERTPQPEAAGCPHLGAKRAAG